jgi:hypothetical protein
MLKGLPLLDLNLEIDGSANSSRRVGQGM